MVGIMNHGVAKKEIRETYRQNNKQIDIEKLKAV